MFMTVLCQVYASVCVFVRVQQGGTLPIGYIHAKNAASVGEDVLQQIPEHTNTSKNCQLSGRRQQQIWLQ